MSTDPSQALTESIEPTETACSRTHYRSKTLAAWLALAGGALGLHRLYLYGLRDPWAWLHPLPTLAGAIGVLRLLNLGQDDAMAPVLLPLLGLMISIGMFCAILYALTPDARWDDRHNPGHAVVPTAWGAVLAAITALLLGGGVLMGSIAYGVQKFFEWQLQVAWVLPQPGAPRDHAARPPAMALNLAPGPPAATPGVGRSTQLSATRSSD